MKYVIFPFALLLFSCKEDKSTTSKEETIQKEITGKSILKTDVLAKISGNSYLKKAHRFQQVIAKDTSNFYCDVTLNKQSNKLSLILNLSEIKSTLTYSEILNELKILLPEIEKEYDLKTLKSVSLGRLIETGDLAIQLSKAYKKELSPSFEVKTYPEISAFLLKSKLSSDMNETFKSYGLNVKSISIEKAFFTVKNEVNWNLKIQTKETEIPEKILDCQTWISF